MVTTGPKRPHRPTLEALTASPSRCAGVPSVGGSRDSDDGVAANLWIAEGQKSPGEDGSAERAGGYGSCDGAGLSPDPVRFAWSVGVEAEGLAEQLVLVERLDGDDLVDGRGLRQDLEHCVLEALDRFRIHEQFLDEPLVAAVRSALATALRDLRTPSLLVGRGVGVHEALGRLRERDRELIHRRYVLDESLQSIADATGKNYEATKRAVQRAVGRLRNEMLADDELKAALLDRPEHPID